MVVRTGRRWGWWGVLFVVAFVASIPVGSALVAGNTLYLPGASAAELRDFYTVSGTAVFVQSALQALAAFALYEFGCGARATVGRGRSVPVMTAGMVAAAGFLLVSDICSILLAVTAQTTSDGLVSGLGKATLLSGGTLHLLGLAVLVTAASGVALRSDTRTRWVFHYGRVVGPLLALSVVSTVWPPFVKAEVLWRLLAIVWIVGVAVAALRGRIGSSQADRPVRTAGVEA
ncbi:hypothetical protein HC031_29605 [Planosporangium thailandense]|uniref:DUF998 domain-containing protein n=1 Tax=Planosporangium thailandense TaxID=765197 RepID=A0ABX0Y9B5_9ACTN|nr:hypothetical protein [Planosporangium thailandense]NJC73839.1 hypothetical protein [Planosporangium thailandense]